VWSTVSNGSTAGSIRQLILLALFASYFYCIAAGVNQLPFITWVITNEYRIRGGDAFCLLFLRPVALPIHSDVADNIMSKALHCRFWLVIAIIFVRWCFHATLRLLPLLSFYLSPGLVAALLPSDFCLLEWDSGTSSILDDPGQRYQSDLLLFYYYSFRTNCTADHSSSCNSDCSEDITVLLERLVFLRKLLLGKITTSAALVGIGVQVVWLIACIIFSPSGCGVWACGCIRRGTMNYYVL